MMEIKVLDHGYVKLVGSMGTDETIVEAARMSTGRGFLDWDEVQECTRCGLRFKVQWTSGYACTNGGHSHDDHDWKKIPGDAKLLAFLYANKHMTPFEMCELAVEVQAPIFVFREWHRHRTQSYNEFSARYEQMPDLHYLPELERFQKQSKTNKQGSAEALTPEVAQRMREMLAEHQGMVYTDYDSNVNTFGLAKEVARINTPVSRYSKMRAKTDLRNWLGFLQLRMAPNAQWEIRQYANAVAEIVKSIWPRTYALFEEHDLHGVHLSRSEAETLRVLLGKQNHDLNAATIDRALKKLGAL